jgi:hypothetical protein
MKKLTFLIAALVILGFGFFVTPHTNAQVTQTSCGMPSNPIGADWTSTVTCMMTRIMVLEGNSAGPQIPISGSIPTQTSCGIPGNPVGADWTPTITCMMTRIMVLEGNNSTQIPVSPTPVLPTQKPVVHTTENSIPTQKPIVSTTNTISSVTTIPLDSDGIRAIQSFLKAEGSFTYSTATGYYGEITRESVKNYQSKNGLTATGQVDATTLAKIKSEVAQVAPTLSTQIQGL